MDKLEQPVPIVKIFVELTTPEGRKMLLDTAEIESIFQQKTEGYWNKNGIWVESVNTQISMRSGDKGYASETYSEVKEAISAAYRAVYGEDE